MQRAWPNDPGCTLKKSVITIYFRVSVETWKLTEEVQQRMLKEPSFWKGVASATP